MIKNILTFLSLNSSLKSYFFVSLFILLFSTLVSGLASKNFLYHLMSVMFLVSIIWFVLKIIKNLWNYFISGSLKPKEEVIETKKKEFFKDLISLKFNIFIYLFILFILSYLLMVFSGPDEHKIVGTVLVVFLYVLGIVLIIYKFYLRMKNFRANSEVIANSLSVPTTQDVQTKPWQEKYLVAITSLLIFVIALFLPAWSVEGWTEPVYGYHIIWLGFLGFMILYFPWYFFVPAIYIVEKISNEKKYRMLASRIFLFLFWFEGFIGTLVFRFGGAADAGDVVVKDVGPSFWMWTIICWYLLISAYIYVNFKEDKIYQYTKNASIFAFLLSFIFIVSYYTN